MEGWDPGQYEQFTEERSQPFFDLLALVRPRAGMKVVDLGCGTGKLTRELHQRLAAHETLGVDSSAEMLAMAERIAEPGLRFSLTDIADFAAVAAYDLVFSNAALHWLDEHDVLLQRFYAALRPGGQLAIQLPANQDHPSQLLAAEVARMEPFHSSMGGWQRIVSVLDPAAYAQCLHASGFVEQHVRLQVYGHVLPGAEDVVQWVKGTVLLAYRQRLPEQLYSSFVETYRRRLMDRLGGGPCFFTYKRILMWARR